MASIGWRGENRQRQGAVQQGVMRQKAAQQQVILLLFFTILTCIRKSSDGIIACVIYFLSLLPLLLMTQLSHDCHPAMLSSPGSLIFEK